jgi:CcmD family protein
MNHLSYLFAAYSIIFVAIFLYVLSLWRRQVRLEDELSHLEQEVREIFRKSGAVKSEMPEGRGVSGA